VKYQISNIKYHHCVIPAGRDDLLNFVFCISIVAFGPLLMFANAAVAEDEFLPSVPEGKTWKLAWSDEFEGTKIDESKWEIMGDWKRRGAFWVKEDSYLDGKGNLLLRTKKDGDRYVRVYETVDRDDSAARKELIHKAVSVKPSPRQFAWQQLEFIGFVHFGVNTFSGREWGTGKEDPAMFNPETLDTDQWCRTMKAAGMKQVILTAKHHDGFCLWQTRYTTHSVASSRWRGGKGDVLRDLVKSCRKYGLKVGVYLSPADLYQIEDPAGLYGNLSKYTERTIPRPVPARPFGDRRTFKYVVDDYNEYFLNQLFELLTEYGPIHEVWFDGAHPKRKGGQTYTYANWYAMIRELAPQAVIFGKGPDVRWCGNEAGRARVAEWSVIPIDTPVGEFTWPDMTAQDLASLDKLASTVDKGGYLHWYPAETDTSIRHGWFWRDEKQRVKTTEHIVDIWYNSVGGNTVLLLNIPPNSDGLFAERDCKVLTEVGKILRETFKTNLAAGAKATASATREGRAFRPANALDGNTDTCWSPPDWATQAELTITMPGKKTFNVIMFQEQIRYHGQRIAKFAIDAQVDGKWQQIAKGQTVGYKKICRTEDVTTNKVRIRILESRLSPTVSNLALFHAPPIEQIISN